MVAADALALDIDVECLLDGVFPVVECTAGDVSAVVEGRHSPFLIDFPESDATRAVNCVHEPDVLVEEVFSHDVKV